MLESVIQDIANSLEIVPPTSTDKGEYTFTFDDDIKVKVFPLNKDKLMMVAEVSAPLPDSPETEKLLKDALQWSLTRLKEHEETLTWDPDSHQMVLAKETPFSELSEKPISGQLEKFLNNVDYWKSALSNESKPNTSRLPL